MRAIDEALVRAALRNVEHALKEIKERGDGLAMFRASIDLLDAQQYLECALPKEAE